MEKKVILITGAAGFIGYFLADSLLKEDKDIEVIGIDNLNEYYDVKLKEKRLRKLYKRTKDPDTGSFIFVKGDISDKLFLLDIFEKYFPEIVVNLAAQAGVRYSTQIQMCILLPI